LQIVIDRATFVNDHSSYTYETTRLLTRLQNKCGCCL